MFDRQRKGGDLMLICAMFALNQMGGCEVRLCETLRDLPLLTHKKAHPHKSSSSFIPCMALDTGSGMPLSLDVSVANVYDY